jgi:diamine N-acetyltransferase
MDMTGYENHPVRSAFLAGERIYLRPLEKTDLEHLQEWVNDPYLRWQIGEVMPSSRADMEAYYERIRADTSRVWFAVVRKEDDCLIGEAGLLRMFPPWRTTDLTIIIGDKAAQGQGFGSETIHLLLDYAFGCLNFHRVSIGVVGTNEQAIRFYERIGFQREGIQRDGYYHDHAYHDFVMMSLLENEFRARRTPP